MSRSDGLGLDLKPFLDAGTSIANSAAAIEVARRNAQAAKAASNAPAPVIMASGSKVPPILIAVAVLGLGLGGYFLLRPRKGGRRR